MIDDLIKKGRAKESDRDAILSRISATADYDVLKDCDLVIEAVFEDRKVKAETYAKAQPLLKADAIFASNTSTLPINSLAEEFKDQGKFIGIHFFSPVEKMMLVEIIVGKNTGDVALATALDYVRVIGKTPIVVNDSRGFFANRCVLRYIAEGNEMLLEGVPPAMIENTAKMAGMPVGPLSLSDEVALDLGLKIMKATEADLGANAIDQAQKKLMVEMVEKQGRFGRKNAKGFYDYPEKGKGQKSLWAGLAALQPKHLDPDTLDVEELKQRFLVVQAVEAARTVEDHVITDHARGRCRLDPGLRLRAVHRRHAVLYRLHGHEEVRRALPQARSQIRLALHAAEAARGHGGQGRDLLRPLPAEEAGGGVTTARRCETARRRSVSI